MQKETPQEKQEETPYRSSEKKKLEAQCTHSYEFPVWA